VESAKLNQSEPPVTAVTPPSGQLLDKSTIANSVLSGAIVALLGFLGLGTLNFLSGGTVISWMGGMTTVTEAQNFKDPPADTRIPNSSKWKFCALTGVQITKEGGKCAVYRDDKTKDWMYFNNGSKLLVFLHLLTITSLNSADVPPLAPERIGVVDVVVSPNANNGLAFTVDRRHRPSARAACTDPLIHAFSIVHG
jgi:hypothetical protein